MIAPDLDAVHLERRHLLVRPKNGTAREVPLTEAMVSQLQMLADADTPNPHGLVWHRSDGSPTTNADDNAALDVALRKAGVDRPGATTHWLRHSYVTLSEHAGIPWAAFSGVSGHSSPEASDPPPPRFLCRSDYVSRLEVGGTKCKKIRVYLQCGR